MMLAPGSWQAKSRLAMAVPRVGMRSLRCWRSFSGSPYHDHQKASRKSDRSSVAGTKVAAEKLHGKGTSRHLWRSKLPDDSKVFQISNEVRSAVREDGPVVALETTIYTHGFPYPDNVSLALDLENIVRAHGAVPATIGILGGVAKIGLTSDEIKTLASGAGNPNTMKVSRRDLPYILGMGLAGSKLNGGTTVSGTMLLANRAGIKVFGTGGLGGVHRGGQDTMDISADLTELGRTPVAVISSGCKSFLDIPRTLEYLETQGATVCTFAEERSGPIDFPAFYTRDSGSKSPMVVQDAREAAAVVFAQRMLGGYNKSGLLFANPIPEKFSIPKAEIDFAIDQAVREATEQGFHGHANTPFILSRIKELTKGNSLPANRALIESNLAMAAKVAVELSKFIASLRNTSVSLPGVRLDQPVASQTSASPHPDIVVYGSVAVDLSCDYAPLSEDANANSTPQPESSDMTSPHMHTSNIATITPSIGGVGHNVALAAHRAGGNLSVQLRSLVAEDLAGKTILSALGDEGLDTTGVHVVPVNDTDKQTHSRTAQYVAVNDAKKDLVLAMADMDLFSSPDSQVDLPVLRPKWSVVDANWHPHTTQKRLSWLELWKSKVAYEPVSVPKSGNVFQPPSPELSQLGVFPKHNIHLATPNQHELAAMHASAKQHEFFESERWWQVIDSLGIPSSGARDRFVALTSRKMTDEGIPLQTVQLLPYIPTILTKLGPDGVLLTELLLPEDLRLTDPATAPYILSRTSNGSTEVGGVYMRRFPAVEVVKDVVSVNGVGDTFLGVLVAGLARGLKLDENLINIAQRGAVMTLRSKEAVSPHLGKLAAELDRLALNKV